MLLLSLLFLLATQYIAGNGLLHLFKIKLSMVKQIALSFICGVLLFSVVPFIVSLMKIPITFGSITIGLMAVVVLMNLGRLRDPKSLHPKNMGLRFPSVKLYDIPFMIVLLVCFIASGWRSFYLPSNARDMLSGPEVLAEYAVKEKTILNSVFTVNLESTNNHLKPPYILDLQIIYKLYGFHFGGVWVGVISICFMLFLYQLLREKIHPVIAGTLMLFFVAAPEVYAYSYMMLFDYSNMVLFFLGIYFLYSYFKSGDRKEFYFSALLFGFATFIRLETLILIAMFLPIFWFYAFKNKLGAKHTVLQSIAMVGIAAVFYFSWINVFLPYYMPGQFNLDDQRNHNLANLDPLFTRFSEMNTKLLNGPWELALWGYIVKLFLVLTIGELVVIRKLSRESVNWLYAAAVVYFGLPLLGYLLPLMDLMNTTKRALFKLMPVIVMVMANNGLLQRLSRAMLNWENAAPKEVVTTPARKPAAGKKQNPKPVRR